MLEDHRKLRSEAFPLLFRQGQPGQAGDMIDINLNRHALSLAGGSSVHFLPRRLRKPFSSTVSTPRDCALSNLDPGSVPTTTKSVFFETLEATRAPASSA